MQNYWWILAIALSLLTSAYVYVNQFVKIKGSLLMVYRGLGTAAVLLPFVFCFAPIHNWAFYALCAAQGLVISLGDNRILNGAKTFGAQVTSLIHPLSIALIFVFWMLLHPADFAALGREPLHLLLILACLLGTTAALILICRAKASRKALGFLLIGMFCEIFIDVTNKETTLAGCRQRQSGGPSRQGAPPAGILEPEKPALCLVFYAFCHCSRHAQNLYDVSDTEPGLCGGDCPRLSGVDFIV